MTIEDAPDPSFVANLEWQLRTALRHGALGGGRPPGRARRLIATAGLVFLSGLVGAAATVGANHFQATQRAALIVQRFEVRAKAARQVGDHAAKVLAETQRAFAAGERSADAVSKARLHVAATEGRARRAELGLEEARLSGQAPKDELSAPTIQGKDFVSDRLRAELTAKMETLTYANEAAGYARSGYELGEATLAKVLSAELLLRLAEVDTREISARLDARGRFVAGALSAAEVERRDLRMLAAHHAERSAARLEAARAFLELVREQYRAGTIRSAGVREAESAAAEAEVEAENARLETRILDQSESEP